MSVVDQQQAVAGAIRKGDARYPRPLAAQPASPVDGQVYEAAPAATPFIYCDDNWTDSDAATGAAVAIGLEKQGLIDIRAVVLDTTLNTGPSSMDSLFFNRGHRFVPIGRSHTTHIPDGTPPYQANLQQKFSRDIGMASDPAVFDGVALMRKVLAAATRPVTIWAGGYLNNLSDLLASTADAYSSLNGHDLIVAKVGATIIPAGRFPTGNENNFNRTTLAKTSAADVCANWPTPITYVGNEVSDYIMCGGNLRSLPYLPGVVQPNTGGVAHVQGVTLGGTGLGGTYTLSGGFGGYGTTPAISVAATAAQVQSAVQRLPGLSAAIVTGAGPYLITMPLVGMVANLIADTTNMTGTTPTVTVATTVTGLLDPVLSALLDQGNPYGRPAWAAISLLIAATDPATAGFTVVKGSNAVNASTGANTWTASTSGKDQYVVKALSDEDYALKIAPLVMPNAAPVLPATGTQIYRDGIWQPADATRRTLGYVSKRDKGTDPTLVVLFNTDDLGDYNDGSSVSLWSDRQGRYSVRQNILAQQPIYRSAIGGKTALSWSGAQQMVSDFLVATSRDWSVYASVRFATVPTSQQSVLSFDTLNAADLFTPKAGRMGINAAGKPFGTRFFGIAGTTDTHATTLTANTWQVVGMRFQGNGVNNVEALLSGAGGGGTAATSTLYPNSGLSLPLNIGGRYWNIYNVEALNGYIHELRVYNVRHTDAQAAAVAAAMA